MNESNEVSEYLSRLPDKEQDVFISIRKNIFSLVPEIEERLSRGVPFFYHRGKRAVGFRSSKNHLSFFIMEGNVLKNLRDEIIHFDNSSTVIRFTPEKLLPDDLIKKLVLARVEEIDQSFLKKSK